MGAPTVGLTAEATGPDPPLMAGSFQWAQLRGYPAQSALRWPKK